MLRTSMSNLITRLRRMINDPAGASEVWDDESLQEALDKNRDDVRYLELQDVETIASGGVVTYTDFYADRGDWESDAVLYSNNYDVLAPTTSDYIVGKWTFATDQTSLRPLRIVGKSYDMNAAAADVLEEWDAMGDSSSDEWREGDVSAKSANGVGSRASQAALYRQKQRPRVIKMVRDD